ncbi:hypothetical protein [Actinoplanes sp. NPDC026619]|uniref:hypothetical protein n=1 Tax=Actinoplanes sp. NPDC026619 TaxID=3155798 RepID=UPI0033CEFF19
MKTLAIILLAVAAPLGAAAGQRATTSPAGCAADQPAIVQAESGNRVGTHLYAVTLRSAVGRDQPRPLSARGPARDIPILTAIPAKFTSASELYKPMPVARATSCI